MKIDLNVELAQVDRLLSRLVRRSSRKLGSLALSATRRGVLELDCAQVGQDFAAGLCELMVCAHVKALERSAWAASTKEVNVLLKRIGKDERAALSKFYGSIAGAATDRTMSSVRDAMLRGVKDVVEGREPRRLPKLKGPAHQLETIGRTQTALAYNAAGWSEAVTDDELWGFEYSTAGDERVRPSHEALDGVRYPKDHEWWDQYAPPNGWNCRCGLQPLYGKNRVKPYRGTPEVDPEFMFNPGLLFAA